MAKKEHHIRYADIPNVGGKKAVLKAWRNLLDEEKMGCAALYQSYEYYVCQLPDGRWIVLTRPGMKGGGDFRVIVEDRSIMKNGKPLRFAVEWGALNLDLLGKYHENAEEYRNKFHPLIERIFLCAGDVTEEELNNVHFETGYDVHFVAQVLKYLFLAEDSTYTLGCGREMAWLEIIPDKNGIIRSTKDAGKVFIPDGVYTLVKDACKQHGELNAKVLVSSGHCVLLADSLINPVAHKKITKDAQKKRSLIEMDSNGIVQKNVDLGHCEPKRLTEVIAGYKIKYFDILKDENGNPVVC